MKLSVQVKQLGKRKCSIEPMSVELTGETPQTVQSLIKAIVCWQVDEYNARPGENDLLKFLTQEEINNQAAAGKISFGVNYNDKQALAEDAVRNALQSYEDGIFRLFINGEEAGTADSSLYLNEGDTLTFIRLAMLSGRLW
ncbi:hypothetical protein [Mediterranea massiliensis]|uniref:hypothetical protein n=1 Tax=Mediterranea massiliensis TaxID=1841865 RepID=UPI0025A38257|nr:hypothetical protein [Mediterranea massiliensis]MDM8338884.1 hypothetical protein [Mediterranea massiliensis]